MVKTVCDVQTKYPKAAPVSSGIPYNNKTVDIASIKLFLPLAKAHKKAKKSLVIVADAIDFNAVPQTITVVPSLLEANDIIEMEEIERDLGF